MTGLIEEIQRDALNLEVPSDTLLRRVKLAAAKLGLNNLESWVEHELNGYQGDLPPYRSILAAPVAWDVYHGWVPIHSNSASFLDLISTAEIRQSVASLEDLLDANTNGPLHLPMLPEQMTILNKMAQTQSPKGAWQVSRGHIVNIMSAVRNLTLDWAVEMEKQGVLGSGMSFEPEEKEQAQQAMTNINIHNYGSIVGNIGNENTTGDFAADVSVTSNIRDLTHKLKNALPALKEEGANTDRLSELIKELELEAESDAPKPSKLRGLLSDTKAVLMGAAGGITAEGALSLISTAVTALGVG